MKNTFEQHYFHNRFVLGVPERVHWSCKRLLTHIQHTRWGCLKVTRTLLILAPLPFRPWKHAQGHESFIL